MADRDIFLGRYDAGRELVESLMARCESGELSVRRAAGLLEERYPGSIQATLMLSRAVGEELAAGELEPPGALAQLEALADLHPVIPELFIQCSLTCLEDGRTADATAYLILASIKSDLYIHSDLLDRLLAEGGSVAEMSKVMRRDDSLATVWPHLGRAGDHAVDHFLVQDVARAGECLRRDEVELVLERSGRLAPTMANMYWDLINTDISEPRGMDLLARLLGHLKPFEAVAPMLEALAACVGMSLHEAVLTLVKLGSLYPEVSRELRRVAAGGGRPGGEDAGPAASGGSPPEPRLAAIDALGLLWRQDGNMAFLREALLSLEPGEEWFEDLHWFLSRALLATGSAEAAAAVARSLEGAGGAELPDDERGRMRAAVARFEPFDDERLDLILAEDPFELVCGPLGEEALKARMTMTLMRELYLSGEMREWIEREERAGFPADRRSVGRNDPCPCGSGRKFKKCCLPLMEAGDDAG